MITCARTYDEDLIKSVLEVLWEDVSDGSVEFEDFTPNTDEWWLELKHDGELLGVYYFHEHNQYTVIGHANILPQHRQQYTKSITKAVARWLRSNLPSQYTKMYTQVPIRYVNVLKYLESIGMKEEIKVMSISLEELYKRNA